MPLPDVDVRVEGFEIEIEGGAPEARAIADSYLPGSWRVVPPVAGDAHRFEIMADGTTIDPGTAWELARKMEEDPRVRRAEPLTVTPGIEDERAPDLTLEAPRPIPPLNWQIDHCNVRPVWNLPVKGDGIVIGHPDTGYMRHREIWTDDATKNRVLHDRGFDFVDEDPDPLVPAGGSTHGTATASVIMAGNNPAGILGVAPGAKLIPIRVDNDVIHWRWGRVRKAIEWAIAQNADVISMSLGGPIDGESLHQAIRRAVGEGIIVISAAGNVWPFVVYPARYDEVLAVAATNVNAAKWADSARGSAVDVCAPGEDVHRATYDASGKETIEHSSGTSYATAVVAGIAALWLSKHGRANLAATYGKGNISRVFRHVVTNHGVRPDPNWDRKNLGAGIIDADAVLRAPLPSAADMAESVVLEAAPAMTPRLDEIAGYFPDTPREQVRDGLMRMLHSSDVNLESDLERYGNELKLQLAMNDEIRAQITGDPAPVVLESGAPTPPIPMSPSLMSRLRPPAP